MSPCKQGSADMPGSEDGIWKQEMEMEMGMVMEMWIIFAVSTILALHHKVIIDRHRKRKIMDRHKKIIIDRRRK